MCLFIDGHAVLFEPLWRTHKKCPAQRRIMKPTTKNTQTSTKKPKILNEAVIFRRSLIYQTKEFFQNSTLHGVRYIAETGRPAGEKSVAWDLSNQKTSPH